MLDQHRAAAAASVDQYTNGPGIGHRETGGRVGIVGIVGGGWATAST